jgi:hypothetical protein
MALSPHYQQILEHIDKLPDTAAIPVPVAALHEGVSRRTIKRSYPLIRISEHRDGVLLGYLRAALVSRAGILRLHRDD